MKKYEIRLKRATYDYVTVRLEGKNAVETQDEADRMLNDGWDPQDDVTAKDADTSFEEWEVLSVDLL